MKKLFLQVYGNDAIPLNIKFKPRFSFFETSNSIFILADTTVSGCITEKLKKNINKEISNFGKSIIYVSMYKNKNDFAESLEGIAWGTYVWCFNDPNHYIHFDDKPTELIIHKA